MNQKIKRYILTGTPGAGKTSVIRYLEMKGHPIIDEAATDVIVLSQATGSAEPWTHPVLFLDQIVQLQKQRQIQANGIPSKIQFFDRSPFCTQALCEWSLKQSSFIPPEPLRNELERALKEEIYQKRVFFIENLGFVQPTEARKITFEGALLFEKIHEEVYTSFGFELVRITPKTLAERAEEILGLL